MLTYLNTKLPPNYLSWTQLYHELNYQGLLDEKIVKFEVDGDIYKVDVQYALEQTLQDVFEVIHSQEDLLELLYIATINDSPKEKLVQFLTGLIKLWDKNKNRNEDGDWLEIQDR